MSTEQSTPRTVDPAESWGAPVDSDPHACRVCGTPSADCDAIYERTQGELCCRACEVLDTSAIHDPAEPTGAWIAGHNLPGYSPESDVPAFTDWDEAWSYLVEEMQRWAEDDDDAWAAVFCGHADGECPDECYGTSAALVESLTSDRLWAENGVTDGQDWGAFTIGNDGRELSWWVQWSPDSTPDPEV